MNNDWFHEYFINELKAIGIKNASKLSYEIVDSLPPSGEEDTIYFVKSDSGSSNNHYDEYAWISSSSAFEKIGSTQIDGSTTQSDWNQNDDTQSDYVKNRPFYTGDPVETVLVEETTVPFEESGDGIYIGGFETTFLPIVGETYKISWDGSVYESTCIEFYETLAIGNLSIAGGGSDTGEPFVFIQEHPGGLAIGTPDTVSSHTISISGTVTPVVKIDPKYLDQSDWDQNDVDAPSYIKNRPFYTGYTEEQTLIKESTAIFKADSDRYKGLLRSTFTPIVGDTYKVLWDDTIYESACFNFEETAAIGNLSIIGAGSDTGEPFIIIIRLPIKIYTLDTAASHTISIRGRIPQIVKIDEKYLPDNAVKYNDSQNLTDAQKQQARTNIGAGTSSFSGNWNDLIGKPIKPSGESYLTFSSPNKFTLSVKSTTKPWDGTLEYFASDGTWTTWDGKNVLSSIACYNEYVLYLRGTGNTFISRSSNLKWILTGADIKCIGNIENLLDYATVKSGAHPTLASNCYSSMFRDCISLIQAPVLPSTILVSDCYSNMFNGCTSLTHAPALPATTLATFCYSNMFNGCTSLTQAPVLPATTLADNCYYYMFRGCTSLTKVPVLPATTLKAYCYTNMFQNCTGLKLSTTLTNEYTQEYRIPSSGDGTTAAGALNNMFISTGGTFAGIPSINTTYYLSMDNMIVRETEISTLNGYVGFMIDAALSAIGVAEEGAY